MDRVHHTVLTGMLALLLVAGALTGCSQPAAASAATAPAASAAGHTPTASPAAMPAPTPLAEPPAPAALTLPETYTISYEITDTGDAGVHISANDASGTDLHLDLEAGGGSRTYTQTMIKAADGCALQLGDTGEAYLFLRLDSGKYTQYRYDAAAGHYTPTLLTDEIRRQIDAGVLTEDSVAVDQNLVDGYAARVTCYFDFYDTFRDILQYQDEEMLDGIPCQVYRASFVTDTGTQDVKVWIDAENGLCRQGTYTWEGSAGSSATRTIVCREYKPNEAVLPAQDPDQ